MKFLLNLTPRDYQQKIYETCKEKNCLVVLPTGLGKTLIALMLSIHRMREFPTEKIVFLAPTKPLAEQHLNYFKKNLPELFADMQLFTGMIKAETREKIWRTTDIIFSTPQCVANDLKNNLYDLENVSLLIEDEAHRCTKNYDYNYLAKKYQEQSSNTRILGLTASPGSELSKIKDICKTLFIEEVELRTRESTDVKPYLQELEFEKIQIELPPKFQELRHVLKKVFDRLVEELIKRNVLFGPATKTNLIILQKRIIMNLSKGSRNFNYMLGASACAQAIKIQHALELLETQTLESFNKYLKNLLNQAAKKQSKGVVKLVNTDEFNFVYTTSNELLAKQVEHPKLKKLMEIIEKEKNNKTKIIIFTQFRDTATIIYRNISKIEGINASTFVGQAKRVNEKGEVTGLSQKQQKQILNDFASGKINTLIATSIGEEGLDIPEVNSVIFYEPIPSAIRAIQRAGRTARLMKGKLIMLITKGTRDEAFYYTSRAKNRRMHAAIKTIKENFANEANKKLEIQKALK